MPAPQASSLKPRASLLLLAGLLALWFASWTGPAEPSSSIVLVLVLVSSAPVAALWMLGALGLGWPLRRWLAPETAHPLIVQSSLGVALLLVLDAAFGRLGLLHLGGLGAAALSAAGIALLALQAWRGWRDGAAMATDTRSRWLPLLAAAPLGVLIAAACSAPGWLWTSEFGGYDALSYHLQLPSEWMGSGRIEGLEHNVYSFLPGYVEASFLHLMLLTGDAVSAVYACQMLHAAIALQAALAIGAAAATMSGARITAPVATLVLGTPWVIVVGSLAYNEMPVCLMLATGLLLLADARVANGRLGAAIGLLAGAACGAKLTAAGFAALPLAAALAWRAGRRGWPALGAGAAAGLVTLAPWLVGNAVETGNPVFPFLTGSLGLGHWSAEQAATWSAGHAADLGLAPSAVELWRQLPGFGLGRSPYGANEPWLPQWSLLPWLALAGVIVAGRRPGPLRRWSIVLGLVMLGQLAFWIALTHLKSRFLLPMVAPMAMAVGLGAAAVPWPRGGLGRGIAIAGVLAWSMLPALLYRDEAGGGPSAMIGAAALRTGEGLNAAQLATITAPWPELHVNRTLTPEARVLMVGEATPLFYMADRVTYQTTWDRGPLSAVMREHGERPAAWMEGLRARGFTHLLVNPTMLGIWERAGWNDPLITASRVIGAADGHATLEAAFSNGVRLYRLDGQRSAVSGQLSAWNSEADG